VAEKRAWIEMDHPSISIREQCELLNVHRSNIYYEPRTESEENLHIMRIMDQEHLKHPFKGRRQMTSYLRREGFEVNHKRVDRLMKLMGIEALAPKPRTTLSRRDHKVFPYLLRHLSIERPDHVWCSDITYIPLHQGYLYLCAVMDWYSRFVLAWRLSNSLDTTLVMEALEAALEYGRPQIFNTDQGSQYTSLAFTGRLIEEGIDISMDGRGRAIDNVFIERLWRTVKYEEVYLKEYESGAETYSSLEQYFKYYNFERSHQSLGDATPRETYSSKPAKQFAGAI
jgi:putative transposase